MIKHIVLWRVQDSVEGKTKGEAALFLKEALESLKGRIPEIHFLEAGVNFNPADFACDLSLYSEFKTRQDLDGYQKHPEHLKVAEQVKKFAIERRVSDYEV